MYTYCNPQKSCNGCKAGGGGGGLQARVHSLLTELSLFLALEFN